MNRNISRYIALPALIILLLTAMACRSEEKHEITTDPISVQAPYGAYFDQQAFELIKDCIDADTLTFIRDDVKVTVSNVLSDNHFNYASISIGAADGSELRGASVNFVPDYDKEKSMFDAALEAGKSEVVYPKTGAAEHGVYTVLLKTYTNDFFYYRKMKAEGSIVLSNGKEQKVEVPFVIPFKNTCAVKKGKPADNIFVKAELSPLGFCFSKMPVDEAHHTAVLMTELGEEIELTMDESSSEYAICMFEKPMDISKISEVRLDGEVITLK